jgi:hypothetical protein
MKKLEAFLPYVLPSVAGCSQPLAEQAIRDSAIQFCEETHYLQLVSDPIDLVAGASEYDIDVPASHSVARLLNTWFGPEQRPTGRPQRAEFIGPSTLRIWPVPQADLPAAMQTCIALKPARTATSLDDSMFNDWVEGIAAGAIYRICMMPGQAFSSDQDAIKAMGVYNLWRGKARFEMTKKRTMTDLTVQMRRFA